MSDTTAINIAIILSAVGLLAAVSTVWMVVRLLGRKRGRHLTDGTYKLKHIRRTPDGEDVYEIENATEDKK